MVVKALEDEHEELSRPLATLSPTARGTVLLMLAVGVITSVLSQQPQAVLLTVVGLLQR